MNSLEGGKLYYFPKKECIPKAKKRGEIDNTREAKPCMMEKMEKKKKKKKGGPT